MVSDRKRSSGHHISDACIFVRPYSESRGRFIRSLSSRKPFVSRNAPVVRDPNTRYAELALSDDLIGRHGSLGTSPGAYRTSVRTRRPRGWGLMGTRFGTIMVRGTERFRDLKCFLKKEIAPALVLISGLFQFYAPPLVGGL